MFKNNVLALKLLRAVFFSYFIVAVTVTIFQMFAEFNRVKERVENEINFLSKSFAPGVAEGLWRYDKNGINASLFGMTQQNVVLGVAVYDANDKLYAASGWVSEDLQKPQFFAKQKEGELENSNARVFSGVLYRFDFPLSYEFKGESSVVGKVSIFSGSDVVLEQVKYGFIIILINSVIKTLALWFIFYAVIHYLVSKPIQSLKAATSQLTPDSKDFSFDVGLIDEESLVNRKDELGTFAQTLVKLRDGLKSRDQIIKIYISTIEQQVEEKTRNIRLLLNSIKQGIFTIDRHHKIGEEFSAHLREILTNQDINGSDISELIFEKSNLTENEHSAAKSALITVFGENEFSWNLNKHLLPRRLIWKPSSDVEKHLEVDWEPITSEEDDSIEKMMIVIRDISEVVKIKSEIQSKKIESETINLLLKGTYGNALRILAESKEMVAENIDLISHGKDLSIATAKVIYRNLHTIKGNVRTYELSIIADEVHRAEYAYANFLNNDIKPKHQELLDGLSHIKKTIHSYEVNLKHKISRFDGMDTDSLAAQAVTESLKLLQKVPTDLKEKVEIKKLVKILKSVNYRSLSKLLKELVNSLPKMSKELGKQAPLLIIEDSDIGFSSELHSTLVNIFTHLFSNSLDHGIENQAERKQYGKPYHGQISLRVEKNDHGFVKLSYGDDGRGINLPLVKERCRELGLGSDKLSVEKQAMMIFAPGFSTKKEASRISGRGMGMDIIKDHIEQLGGKVSLKLEQAELEHHYRFELSMFLPVECTDLSEASRDLLAS